MEIFQLEGFFYLYLAYNLLNPFNLSINQSVYYFEIYLRNIPSRSQEVFLIHWSTFALADLGNFIKGERSLKLYQGC